MTDLYGPGGPDTADVAEALVRTLQSLIDDLLIGATPADGSVYDASVATDADIAQSKIADLVDDLAALVAVDTLEASTRAAADAVLAAAATALDGRLDTIEGGGPYATSAALATEASSRAAADSALTTAVNARALATDLTAETAARAAADTAHAGAVDPHPGYLTPAEGNAAYDAAGAAAAAQAFAIQRANQTGTQLAATVSDFTEAAQDAVGAALADTATLDLTYNDGANTISGAVLDSPTVAGATPAQLRDRSTHTGAQAIATVTGLQTALDAKALASDLTAEAVARAAADATLTTAVSARVRLPAVDGTDGQVLVRDSTLPEGTRWATVSAGGVGVALVTLAGVALVTLAGDPLVTLAP